MNEMTAISIASEPAEIAKIYADESGAEAISRRIREIAMGRVPGVSIQF